MKRISHLACFAAAWWVTAAHAEPAFEVTYVGGVPRVQIAGDYAHSVYTVWRAPGADGPWTAVTNHEILCLGSCFADDRDALPDVTYWYRFDLLLPDGSRVSYGPYPTRFSAELLRRLAVRVYPNPSSGPSNIEVFVAGAAGAPGFAARVTLHDAQGRLVRRIHQGRLETGRTSFQWDGLDASGLRLRPGAYFLRLETAAGGASTNLTRIR